MAKDTCKNCGGWKGLHHWETMQCPFGGVESGLDRPDVWVGTHYEEEDDTVKDLRDEVEILKAQVAALLAAVPSAKVKR
jgi:hypothetical protein